MGIDYARELPAVPAAHGHARSPCTRAWRVVAGLFVWGCVRRYRRYRGAGGGPLAGRRTATALPWGPRLRRAVRRRRRPDQGARAPPAGGPAPAASSTAWSCCSSAPRSWSSTRTSSLVRRLHARGAFYVRLRGRARCRRAGARRRRRHRAVAAAGHAARVPAAPELRPRSSSAACSSWALSGFGLEAYRIAAQPNDWAAAAFVGWSPVASARRRGRADSGAAVRVYRVLWWTARRRRLRADRGPGVERLLARAGAPGHRRRPRPARGHGHELTTPFNLIAAMESEEDVELVARHGGHRASSRRPSRLAADACVACGRCHAGVPGAGRRTAALAARPHAGRAQRRSAPTSAAQSPSRAGRRLRGTPSGRAPTATPASRPARRGSVTSTTSSTSAAPWSTRTVSTSRSSACCRRSTATRTRTSCRRTSARRG